MTSTITPTIFENAQIKSHPNTETAEIGDASVIENVNVDEADSAREREPDFAELHASFEIEYEEFLADIGIEIAICAQRLSELESIIGKSPSE
jgi:hypothetical protein